jgi:hypothetical protein
VRGPKKKKDSEVRIESTDIVNIFKDRADPEITDIREYPVYVQELSRGTFSIHEYYQGVQTNRGFMVSMYQQRCLAGQT